MPEPQPGADRPVDGNRPDTHRNGESAVTQEQTLDPAPPATTSAADETQPVGDADPTSPAEPSRPTPPAAPLDPTRAEAAPARAEVAPDQTRVEPDPTRAEVAPTRAGTAPDPTQPVDEIDSTRPVTEADSTRPVDEADGGHDSTPSEDDARTTVAPPPEVGPQGTRMMPEATPVPDATAVEEPAPRWSGSAAVPPPPPRRRVWGQSAEPTLLPPVAPADAPEHQTPVDPWAGVDTSGWHLPSSDMPALPPPTLSYPAPPATRSYTPVPPPVPPAPPAHRPAAYPPPVSSAPPAHQPAAYPPPVSPAPPAHQPAAYPPQAGRPAPPAPAAPMRPPAAQGRPQPAAQPPVRHAPPPPQPVAPPPVRGWRGRKAGPPAPPPGWQAPPGYARRRKRRRWPWMLLLTIACCCGCPAYYGVPMASQYPASASLPSQVADLELRQDDRSTQAARQLESQVRQAHLLADGTFAGIYATSAGKQVTVFGGTGFRFAPSADADSEIERLTQQYSLGEAQVVETGVRGRHERCAVGTVDGVGVVVCTSVDHGSITSAVFTGLSVDDSAQLLATMRRQIVSTNGG
ncbi:hypothetical protein ACIBO1_26415 [Micromonospora sp. NPDC049903]|uniref:hypothetical protein n=1 Tax=Micromonospora sp. NPDC049903 TaxID=3364276 RepID=UPI00379105E3